RRNKPTSAWRGPAGAGSGALLTGQALVARAPRFELVQRIDERQGTRLDDVRMRALAGGRDAVLGDEARHLAQRVGAAGDRFDRVAFELRTDAGDLRDRLVAGVDHAVAGALAAPFAAVDAQADGGVRQCLVGGGDIDLEQLEAIRGAHGFLGDDGDKVVVV